MQTAFTYNPNGDSELFTIKDPMGRTTTMTYDALSRLSKMTDRDGNTTNYTYDAFDRVLSTIYNQGTSTVRTFTYSYDDDGNTFSQSDATGTTSFTYDILNRQTNKQIPGGPNIVSTYDNIGNLTSLSDGTLQETLNANPYTYADDDPVNNVDPNGQLGINPKCYRNAQEMLRRI